MSKDDHRPLCYLEPNKISYMHVLIVALCFHNISFSVAPDIF